MVITGNLQAQYNESDLLSFQKNVGGICKWDYNKKAAVVLTFDDWTPGQFPLVVPALKQFKMVATFFPLTNNIEKSDFGWKSAQKTVENGNELGNHTLTHPDITKLTDEKLEKEVGEPLLQIEKNVPNNAVISFAYPYGAGAENQHSIEYLRSKGFVGARSVWGMSDYSYNFVKEDDDYYRIHIFGMNEKTSNTQFYAEVQSVIAGGGLLTFLYHSVDDDLNSYHDNWFAQVKLDSLKEQLRFLKSNKNDVWVTTFGNAVLYHREANCAKLKENKSNVAGERHFSLYIENSNFKKLVPQILVVPLSIIVLKTQDEGTYTSVTQNGQELPIDGQTDSYIQFRAIPTLEKNGNPMEICLKR
ncbi:MAG: polysaccharide deacetylase family protein [Bacteroidales bacterium]|nr:polysaccharide deacetylase family protein [Bacteroidales bacterium]